MKLLEKQDVQCCYFQFFVDWFKVKVLKVKQVQFWVKMFECMKFVVMIVDDLVVLFEFFNFQCCMVLLIICMLDFKVGYELGKYILCDFNLNIDLDDCIGIFGCNGVGKLIMVKLFCGKLDLQDGFLCKYKKFKIVYFVQYQIDMFLLEVLVYQYVVECMEDVIEVQCCVCLVMFGLLGDCQEMLVKLLFGGEKVWLFFNLIIFDGLYLFIFDELINYLDMDSCVELINVINNYEGVVVLIFYD